MFGVWRDGVKFVVNKSAINMLRIREVKTKHSLPLRFTIWIGLERNEERLIKYKDNEDSHNVVYK